MLHLRAAEVWRLPQAFVECFCVKLAELADAVLGFVDLSCAVVAVTTHLHHTYVSR